MTLKQIINSALVEFALDTNVELFHNFQNIFVLNQDCLCEGYYG